MNRVKNHQLLLLGHAERICKTRIPKALKPKCKGMTHGPTHYKNKIVKPFTRGNREERKELISKGKYCKKTEASVTQNKER